MPEQLYAEHHRPGHPVPPGQQRPVDIHDVKAGDSVLLVFEVVNVFPERNLVTVRRVGSPKLGMTAASPQLGPLRFGILGTDIVRRIPLGEPLPAPPWPPMTPKDE